MRENEVECRFVSVWDDGVEVRTKAVYNPEENSFEVLEQADVRGVDVLQREYLELSSGEEIEICKACHEGIIVSLSEGKVCNRCGWNE